ncbi:hypothetical protein SAMN05444371_2731 [Epilithonimonas mollis]|uniref:Uncharacterized protein n=1 Tax=Epilithonimonas mollis TaxID=216903 RepID=A0A1M6T9H3_9FLAO|nr:hypothetical protein SAMN05444371_2731 [Epilithonimonas mollis]
MVANSKIIFSNANFETVIGSFVKDIASVITVIAMGEWFIHKKTCRINCRFK